MTPSRSNCFEARPDSVVLLLTTVVAVLVSPSIQMAYQWERAVVLGVALTGSAQHE